MSECTHDCSTCSEACASREMKPEDFLKPLCNGSRVGKVYAVVSGKGGVGKSLVTSMLAVNASAMGYKTAILDADVTGPSIPKTFGLDIRIGATEDNIMIPATTSTGISIISTNLLLDNQTDPVVWRGPVISSVVEQFWSQTLWTDIDYMFVDMPPGTGDVPLTVFQSIPVDGIIIVTSPQELVGMIVEKAVKMAEMMKVPVKGIIENMSYFKCPDCGKEHYIFGESRTDEVAKQYGIPVLAKLPLDPRIRQSVDEGLIEYAKVDYLSDVIKSL